MSYRVAIAMVDGKRPMCDEDSGAESEDEVFGGQCGQCDALVDDTRTDLGNCSLCASGWPAGSRNIRAPCSQQCDQCLRTCSVCNASFTSLHYVYTTFKGLDTEVGICLRCAFAYKTRQFDRDFYAFLGDDPRAFDVYLVRIGAHYQLPPLYAKSVLPGETKE